MNTPRKTTSEQNLSPDAITSASRVKLRLFNVFNEMGKFTKEDLVRHPWKALPIIIPIPTGGLCLLAATGIVAGTIVIHARKKNFRNRFSQAAKGPIDMESVQKFLRTNTSGRQYAATSLILKHHAGNIYLHSNHLLYLNLEKISNENWRAKLQNAHQKYTKFDPNMIENDASLINPPDV